MIQLKEAQFEDHAAIAELHATGWQLHYRGIYNDSFLDNEVVYDRLKVWHGRLESPHPKQKVIVAASNDTIVGFACILLDDDPVFGTLLDNLHVTAGMQKTGIGRTLLRHCANLIVKEATIHQLYLWVYEANHNARKAYDRLNGVHHETVEYKNVDGSVANAFRYVWKDLSLLA